jgi:hypothetical protein
MSEDEFQMKPKVIIKRIGEQFRTGDPDSPVNQVIARWKGHDFTVKVNGQWRLEGFIDYFRWWNDLACAVDSTQPRSLPPQCFDPIGIARLFGLPVEEFARYLPRQPNQIFGDPGRKNTTKEIAAFAAVRREEGKTWKEIYDEWKHNHPDDAIVKTADTIREAYRRHYADKANKPY